MDENKACHRCRILFPVLVSDGRLCSICAIEHARYLRDLRDYNIMLENARNGNYINMKRPSFDNKYWM